jgi:hypothetical protein
MLYKISKGGVGMTLFVGFLVYLGVPVELAEGGAAGIMSLLALGLWFWGQLDRKDLKWGLFRK